MNALGYPWQTGGVKYQGKSGNKKDFYKKKRGNGVTRTAGVLLQAAPVAKESEN